MHLYEFLLKSAAGLTSLQIYAENISEAVSMILDSGCPERMIQQINITYREES